MFLCGTGKYQDVLNEDDNKVIKIFTKDVLYQMHELWGGVSNTKRHQQKFIRSPTRLKCLLMCIFIAYWHVLVSQPQINFAKHLRTLEIGDTFVGFWGTWTFYFLFPTTYHVLGTVLWLYNSFFLWFCILSPTVWWWEMYFIDCDVIVIDSVWFTFVSVPTRSWVQVSGDPAT